MFLYNIMYNAQAQLFKTKICNAEIFQYHVGGGPLIIRLLGPGTVFYLVCT